MKTKFTLLFLLCLAMAACRKAPGGQTATHEGDTIRLKYAQKLTIVRHKEYTEVKLSDPWNIGKTLHTYLLVPADAQLPGQMPQGTVIRTPVRRAVISTSVHCGLVDQLGQRDAVKGVCDVQYIHLPWMQERVKNGQVKDCGSALQPTLETIIDLQADAIFLSPFQNSGGYGRLEKIGIPIVEMADYMETSALGRAEWMRFYGMLFGATGQADSLAAGLAGLAHHGIVIVEFRSVVRLGHGVVHGGGAVVGGIVTVIGGGLVRLGQAAAVGADAQVVVNVFSAV